MSQPVYPLDQNLPYSSATCKKLENTLKAHKITIPNKFPKPALYKQFYFLCQTKNYSIIPNSKNHMAIDDYVKLHTTKSSNAKRKQSKNKPPKKRQQVENHEKTDTDMDLSGNSDEHNTIPETDIDDTTSLPPRPIRFSTPNEIISIDDDIYENNQNQNPISIDEKIFENNSKYEKMSLDDDIYN